MKVEVHYKHSNTAARIELESGESCTTEAGSMVAMNSHISVETTTYKKGKGSILKSLKRMITGESFFLNHYTPDSRVKFGFQPLFLVTLKSMNYKDKD